MNSRRRGAFSLAEVLFSLVLLLLGVLTLLAFLPTALKQVQKSRFQIYAGTKAVDLIEGFVSTHPVYQFHATNGNNFYTCMQLEANKPWDHPAGYKAFAPDLDAFSAGSRSGFYPLPETIAYRLESDHDEIRAILDGGGQIYYANPAANNGVKQEWTFDVNPPRDAQRLIFAVRGSAQQNAMPFFPWKAWPYYAPYPSPPMGSGPYGTNLTANNWGDMTSTGYQSILALWERENPADLKLNILANFGINQADSKDRKDIFGKWDSAGFGGTSLYRDACEDKALGYLASKYQLALALWYARKVSLPIPMTTGQATISDLFLDDPTDPTPPPGVKRKVYQNGEFVRAMRFLAWAGMCMTRWYALEGQRAIVGDGVKPAVGATPGQADLGLTPHQPVGGTRYNANMPTYPAHPGLRTGIPIPGVDTDDQSRWIDLSRNVLQPAGNWSAANHRYGGRPIAPPNRDAPLLTSEGNAATINAWFAANAPHSLAEVFAQIDLVDGANDGDQALAAAISVPNLPLPLAYMALPAVDTELPPGGRLGLPNDTNRFTAAVALAGGLNDGQFFVTFEQITTWYELGLRMAMRHAADNPYDWKALRPINRQIMTDHPLIQWDLFPSQLYPKLTGQITGIANDAYFSPRLSAADRVAEMWRPIAARDITNAGRSGNNTPVDWSALHGDQSHFNLTVPFSGSERCRELIFWMVDWTSYEDFETAPAARVDASRYPKNSPEGNYTWSSASQSNTADDYTSLCGVGGWRLYPYDELQPMWRHPEKSWLFTAPTNGYADLESRLTVAGVDAICPMPRPALFTQPLATGSPIAPLTCGPDWSDLGNNLGGRQYYRYASQGGVFYAPDIGIGRRTASMQWSTAINGAANTNNYDTRAVFTGLFGADRNANGVIDRGPVSKAVRLRAVEVGRYNFYDPRLVLYRR